jgi:divalent metal cation (Fe/Co/Zn/Cd) transporter
MNDPQYLAQVGHFLGGVCLLATTALLFGAVPSMIALGVGVVAAAIKEFWYDMKYELPKQTWDDSLMDFGFYVLGAAAGSGLVLLAHHLGRC